MADSSKQVELYVTGLDCENEAGKIRRGLQGTSGLLELRVFAKAGKVSLTFNPATRNLDSFKKKLAEIGFETHEGIKAVSQTKPWQNPKVVTSFISGCLLLAGWLVTKTETREFIPLVALFLSMLIGGYYFGKEGLEDLFHERKVGIELLMAVAAISAFALGQYAEGAMLAFLYSMSEAAEGYTEEKTRSAVKALMSLTPKVARVRRDGEELDVPLEELNVGDIFLVRPGESVATDGEVIVGISDVNQAPVTGESLPVEKTIGTKVFAGSINGEGFLEVKALQTFANNTISRIIKMVEESQEKKGKSQKFIERFGALYTPIVLGVGILIALVPVVLSGGSWSTWASRAVVFIVAAAPCALVISIPITLVASLGTAARKGVLIKGGIYVEELAKIKVVALDKTGTITAGKPEVTDVLLTGQSVDGAPRDSDALVALAMAIEKYSQHPLAQAVVRFANSKKISTTTSIKDFKSITGAGAQAVVDGKTIFVGSPQLFETIIGGVLKESKEISRLQDEGKTTMVIGCERGVFGLIAIRDNIRTNAVKALRALREAGVEKIVMLTGDNERTAQVIAREVGIDEVRADLKPEDKVKVVRDLHTRFGHVAMVGDGGSCH